jgi:hypothetical protein
MNVRRGKKMARTHDFGKKHFWHVMVYPLKPKVIFETSTTQEIEHPFRFGKGWVFRIPFTRVSLVIGKWVAKYEESQALTNAIAGRPVEQDEFDWDIVRGEEYDV